jgi:hypothetical protein
LSGRGKTGDAKQPVPPGRGLVEQACKRQMRARQIGRGPAHGAVFANLRPNAIDRACRKDLELRAALGTANDGTPTPNREMQIKIVAWKGLVNIGRVGVTAVLILLVTDKYSSIISQAIVFIIKFIDAEIYFQ